MSTPYAVPSSLISPADLPVGTAFLIPPLLMPRTPLWWHVADRVDLPGADAEPGRVRLILTESDHQGRPYRVELEAADRVVWTAGAVPSILAPPRLGHHVSCARSWCRRPWGYLPVTVCDTPCFRCTRARPVGI